MNLNSRRKTGITFQSHRRNPFLHVFQPGAYVPFSPTVDISLPHRTNGCAGVRIAASAAGFNVNLKENSPVNKSALNNVISACFFLLMLSAWTTWLMLHYGADVLQWIMANSTLFSRTLALSTWQPEWGWTNQLNLVCWLLIFTTGGLLASLLTSLALRTVSDVLTLLARPLVTWSRRV
ncbi:MULTISPECIES: hypothetical protein [unclassified Kosakonia]|uniref:hypothetical protein n=1 Tax=unclassified Kosakonia TaxID=2632876 RepID=UPI001F456EAC|nr:MULTISPECIES: hypothetical protein [unclassified Kosakonia]